MNVTLIVATGRNGEIGKDNALLWKIPEDMRFFKHVTLHRPVVMGRKTYESIGRPLPGRTNCILTRDKEFKADGCLIYHSIGELFEDFKFEDIMVIGGDSIYRQFMPYATKAYITEVDGDFDADTFFRLEGTGWKRFWERVGETSDPFPYRFTYHKRILKD